MNEVIQMNLSSIFLVTMAVILVLLILNIFLFFRYKKISRLAGDFFAGKNGRDLEAVISSQKKQIDKVENDTKELFDGYEKIYKMAFKGIHKIGIVRYNPFNDIGGNQSFVVALLDGDKSGIIITSLHTRENTRIFSKPIFKGEPLGGILTDEEKRAINSAKVSKKNSQV